MTSLHAAREACAQEVALEQRARLLDAVWDDAQREHRSILRDTLHPHDLPPLPPGTGGLRDYAVDLACAPDGIWRVTQDCAGGHPGAALLEAPLLLALLPGLCRSLLGQSLLLPSMPAWWLGDSVTLRMLQADPRRYALLRSFDREAAPMPLAELSPASRRCLQDVFAAAPHHYVAMLNLKLPTRRVHLRRYPGEGLHQKLTNS